MAWRLREPEIICRSQPVHTLGVLGAGAAVQDALQDAEGQVEVQGLGHGGWFLLLEQGIGDQAGQLQQLVVPATWYCGA